VHKVKSWQDQQLRDEPYTRSYEILKKPSSLLSFRVVVCCVCLSSLNRVTWAEWWPWNAQEKPISRCRSTTQSLSPLFFPPPYRTRVIRYRLFTENSLLFLSLFLVLFFSFLIFLFRVFTSEIFWGFSFFYGGTPTLDSLKSLRFSSSHLHQQIYVKAFFFSFFNEEEDRNRARWMDPSVGNTLLRCGIGW
jgi:hypothetical protein